jgi:CheY-like chemotaxis protein
VLVVNDDSLVLASLADVLVAAGVEARTAASAEEAVQVLEGGFRPNVVVVDMQLGRGDDDGEGLIGWMRGTPGQANVPIVAISASPWRLRRVEESVEATLEVPFTLEDLERTLSEICAQAAA